MNRPPFRPPCVVITRVGDKVTSRRVFRLRHNDYPAYLYDEYAGDYAYDDEDGLGYMCGHTREEHQALEKGAKLPRQSELDRLLSGRLDRLIKEGN